MGLAQVAPAISILTVAAASYVVHCRCFGLNNELGFGFRALLLSMKGYLCTNHDGMKTLVRRSQNQNLSQTIVCHFVSNMKEHHTGPTRATGKYDNKGNPYPSPENVLRSLFLKRLSAASATLGLHTLYVGTHSIPRTRNGAPKKTMTTAVLILQLF